MILGLFPDLGSHGGVQEAGRQVAGALAIRAGRLGMNCRFLSLNDPAGWHEMSYGAGRFRFRGFRRNKAAFVAAALQRSSPDGQIVFAAHPHLAPVAEWMRLRNAHLRLAVLAHGIEVWRPLSTLRRRALRRADLVIGVSDYTTKALIQIQGVPAERARTLPLALSPSFDALCSSRDGVAFAELSSNPPTVLTVARLAADEQYKGVDTLIRAVSSLQGAPASTNLIIVGDGADRPRLESLARERGVADRVQFFGHVSQEDLLRCYRLADVFAMPSGGEGFGLVYLEAMACGKPVIAGLPGGAADIVQDGTNGYIVRHGEVEKLIAILQQLLDDQELRRKVGDRGRQTVRNKFLFEHFQQRLERVVTDLCES